MTTPTVNMIAPSTFGGIVEGTPSGTVYTGTPGSVVAVQYADITTLAGLGFTNASGSASQNPVTSGTMSASPFTFTNNAGYPVQIGPTTNAGNVSATSLIRNTVTTTVTPLSSGFLRLSPGDAAVFTWGTAAPHYVAIPG